MELRDLHATVGVEVTGEAASAEDIDALRNALDRRHLLLLRNEVLEPQLQMAFVGRFGPIVPERNIWGYVSNVREDGIVREGALLFHSDFAFTFAPVLAISLLAIEMPDDGSPTLFADAASAARALPADLRSRLDGRRVLNVYDFTRPNDQPMRVADVDERSPRQEHPVLGRHPRTGEEVVMANEMHSDCIVGLPRTESDALLRDLFAVLYDPANIYEHRWSVGDHVLWDNVALHHGRRDIPRDVPRTLQRITLGLYTPDELVPNLAELLAAR